MDYSISYSNPLNHFLEIDLVVDNITQPSIDLRLPLWRPGRYEAANFAKNIQKISASTDNKALSIDKITPGHWQVNTESIRRLTISYSYYADQMDAGSSVLNEELVYVNFVNCLLYVEDRMDEACTVTLDLPSSYQVACGLPKSGQYLKAQNYYHLVDSPVMAGGSIEKYEYHVEGTSFYIWLNGIHSLNVRQVLEQFKKFSKIQIDLLKEFPEKDYHFLFHLLPYKFYHGVEHGNSTVITIGPGEDLEKPELYNEFLGVSSHELFHAWNIIKIRPKEMLPYNFGAPPVFPTGFVAEGFTTYYGDLFLKRSGVFSWEQYKYELEKLLTRHLLNFGRLNNSVVDSSMDLWIDGYQPGAPHKKSSIYVEGAIMALLFDLHARASTANTRSLDDVIRILWTRFGKKGIGYTLSDIEQVCTEVSESSASLLFENYIKGTKDTRPLLEELLLKFGIELSFKDRENTLERVMGVQTVEVEDGHRIVQIEPGAPGEQYFSYGDVIVTIDQQPMKEWLEQPDIRESVLIELKRKSVKRKVTIVPSTSASYLKLPIVNKITDTSREQQEAQRLWLES